MWEEDRCDFAQVTIALGRLQQVARLLSPRFQAAATAKSGANSLLLLPTPGEQHSFGLLILAEFFQRAGWRVAGGPKSTGINAAEMARQVWFDIAGFSIGSERLVEDLARTIRQVRRASRNRGLCVLVGGSLLRERPELAAAVGADAMAMDPPAALRVATDLLTMRAAAE
jgi:methylmalonyl-CoA mutase cobalamin-binding subunit